VLKTVRSDRLDLAQLFRLGSEIGLQIYKNLAVGLCGKIEMRRLLLASATTAPLPDRHGCKRRADYLA
jgi:hypothetical protein